MTFALAEPFTLKRWAEYDRRYRAQMSKSGPQHLIATLAALSAQTNFPVGCYCENEHYCHRSCLRRRFSARRRLPYVGARWMLHAV